MEASHVRVRVRRSAVVRYARKKMPWATASFLSFVSLSTSLMGNQVAARAGAFAHEAVDGLAVEQVEITGPKGGAAKHVSFSDLGKADPGVYTIKFSVQGDALQIPHCSGRGRVFVDGTLRDRDSKGPLLLPLDTSKKHVVRFEVTVSAYDKRIACGEPPKVGAFAPSSEGLGLLHFQSPFVSQGGGEAVVFIPHNHDKRKPSALLVGTHPWNGGPWTYAAYRELLDAAQAHDMVLLMPSGLGNSLYTETSEEEVMRAIDFLSGEMAIDRQRVSIWGASMGGAGATTIAFHRPDRFAFVTSYFGDSKYDMTTYVRSILGNDAGAHKVNTLDVVENARYLPVWLIHGENDQTSPVSQSVMLSDAMKKAGFKVDFDRVAGMGHESPLVVRFIRRVVDRAESARAPSRPARVSYRSVRSSDAEAYGVRIVRAGDVDAFIDIERRDDTIQVLGVSGISHVLLLPGALGSHVGEPVRMGPGVLPVDVRWGT